MKFDAGAATALEEETDVDGVLADDDGVTIGEQPAVDVDCEVAGFKAGERASHAAHKLIVGSACADGFAHGERKQIAYTEGRGERERHRAAGGDGMEIERHANAYHYALFWRIFEEPPAVGE